MEPDEIKLVESIVDFDVGWWIKSALLCIN